MAAVANSLKTGTLAGAMVRTGSASIVTGILSLISAKILATVAGPAGVGLLATLQQTRQTAIVAATMNGQTAFVQGVSSSIGEGRAGFLRTVAATFALATLLVLAALLLAPEILAGWTGLGPERAWLLQWLALPVVASSAFVYLCSFLNASREVGKLAVLQVASPFATAVLMYPAARLTDLGWTWAFPVLISVAAVFSTSVAWAALGPRKNELLQALRSRTGWWDLRCAASFFSIAGAMFATGMMGSAAILFVRAGIVRADGLAATGQFDAAWSISMNQVTLVLSSMQTFFLPTLASSADVRERSRHVSQAILMAAAVAAPLAVSIAILKPLVIGALYSSEFDSAARYLRWTLIGDYLKVASWIFSVSMIAASDVRGFLIADVVAFGTFVVAATMLSGRLTHAEAAACAFVLMYTAHLIVCGCCAAYRGIRVSQRAVGLWLAGFAFVCLASAWTWEVR